MSQDAKLTDYEFKRVAHNLNNVVTLLVALDKWREEGALAEDYHEFASGVVTGAGAALLLLYREAGGDARKDVLLPGLRDLDAGEPPTSKLRLIKGPFDEPSGEEGSADL